MSLFIQQMMRMLKVSGLSAAQRDPFTHRMKSVSQKSNSKGMAGTLSLTHPEEDQFVGSVLLQEQSYAQAMFSDWNQRLVWQDNADYLI